MEIFHGYRNLKWWFAMEIFHGCKGISCMEIFHGFNNYHSIRGMYTDYSLLTSETVKTPKRGFDCFAVTLIYSKQKKGYHYDY